MKHYIFVISLLIPVISFSTVDTACSSGYIWDGENCVASPKDKIDTACPDGEVWNGSSCETTNARN